MENPPLDPVPEMPPATAIAHGQVDLPAAPAPPAIAVVGGYTCTRESLRDWLHHEFPDRRVVEAAGAEDLRRVARAETIGIAIVDIDLPGMQGIELLRLVRVLAPNAAPVALSAYHAESYRDYAIGAGAVACLSPQVADGSLRDLVGLLLRAAPDRGAP